MKESPLADKIRKEITGIVIEFVAPLGAFSIYVKFVGMDYAFTDWIGFLIGAGIMIVSFTWSKMLYEYLFPKYSDDVANIY